MSAMKGGRLGTWMHGDVGVCFALENSVLGMDFNHVLIFDGASKAARVGIAQHWAGIDYKVARFDCI